MRAKGAQKYITAMFPAELCFLSHEERVAFKQNLGRVTLKLSSETNR